VVVGDSVVDDVEPALRAGMRAVLTREFARGAAARVPPGVPVLDRLDQLPGLLRA
jgi:FMN phosphatase YigB (HAD superfamily)